MDTISVSTNKDYTLFQQILGDNISMLFGDSDRMITELFNEKVLDRIKSLEIRDWNYKDEDLNEKVHGHTRFSSDGLTDIKMYGTSEYNGDIKYIEVIFSHELWHALMVIFNNVYGSYFKRNAFLDADIYDVSNYSGFFKCDTDGYEYTPGYYMADSLAQLLAVAVVKKRNESDFIIDDLFRYNNCIDDKHFLSPTDDLLTFFQMFVSAFSLSSDNWMDKNYLHNKGLLEASRIGKKSSVLPNNIFISESIRNPIAVMDEFDKYEYKSAYLELLTKIDKAYKQYVEGHGIDTKSFIEISKVLKDFVNKRLYDYLKKELITEEEYAGILQEFNSLYDVFMREIRTYKVTSARVKFKKRVKKLLNMRIK